MTPRHQVSRTAIELIKRFEGYRQRAAQLPDGGWTIGYGHTRTARQGAAVSEADAEALLLYDLIGVSKAVADQTYAPLNQNEFDALCAFAFSVGLEAFRRSAVLKRVNEGDFTQAAFAMELWRKAEFEGEPIVIDALVRRRAAEKLLFLTPADGIWRAAPSAVLRPQIDLDGIDTTPRQTPSAVVAETEGEHVRLRREEPAADRQAPPPVAHAPATEPESPVKAAAEAVAARLQALFPEPELEAEPAPQDLGEEPEPAPSEPLEAVPPPVEEPEPQPEPRPAPQAATNGGDRPRIVIDDTAPFEFIPPPVHPLPREPAEGVLTMVFLAILGLAFFAGGVFWALAAEPAPEGALLTPVVVGWLAGLAGVGFLAAAVFLFLQRLSRASERRGDHPRL